MLLVLSSSFGQDHKNYPFEDISLSTEQRVEDFSANFDDKAVYETFDVISDEAPAKYHNYQKNKEYERYKGLTFWTPNINIFRDPRWGREMETYGEDPYLTSRIGEAVVKGLQGDDPKYFKVLACAKHYAVHSGPEWSRHEINVSLRRLLKGRFKLGMFDPDDQVKRSKIPYSAVDRDKHKEKALNGAQEYCLVKKPGQYAAIE